MERVRRAIRAAQGHVRAADILLATPDGIRPDAIRRVAVRRVLDVPVDGLPTPKAVPSFTHTRLRLPSAVTGHDGVGSASQASNAAAQGRPVVGAFTRTRPETRPVGDLGGAAGPGTIQVVLHTAVVGRPGGLPNGVATLRVGAPAAPEVVVPSVLLQVLVEVVVTRQTTPTASVRPIRAIVGPTGPPAAAHEGPPRPTDDTGTRQAIGLLVGAVGPVLPEAADQD